MPRKKTQLAVETEILFASRRRCALCFGLNADHGTKPGQIAHVDRNPANSAAANLAWLCLSHHDEYDTRRSQSKGFTPEELKRYREELYTYNATQRAELELDGPEVSLSPEGSKLAAYLSMRSMNGHALDPRVRIDALPPALDLTESDIDMAIDELTSVGMLEINGAHEFVYPTNRLFWGTDPIFRYSDPAEDAAAVARALVAHSTDSMGMENLCSLLKWEPRRLNPAATYLVETGNAQGQQASGSAPFWYVWVVRTVATKRFVRDLDRPASVPARSNVPPSGNVDREVFQTLREQLPYFPTFDYLKGRNFAGWSFDRDQLDPLFHYAYYADRPENEFLDPELEAARQAMIAALRRFDRAIGHHTFPLKGVQGRLSSIPEEWEVSDPDRFGTAVSEVHKAADETETSYTALIRLARQRLGIA